MQRQQVLYLWLAEGALDTEVIAWAFHDGTDGAGPPLPAGEPPYATGVEALKDGWMLIQSAQLVPPPPDLEYVNAYLDYEFVFERRVGA